MSSCGVQLAVSDMTQPVEVIAIVGMLFKWQLQAWVVATAASEDSAQAVFDPVGLVLVFCMDYPVILPIRTFC